MNKVGNLLLGSPWLLTSVTSKNEPAPAITIT